MEWCVCFSYTMPNSKFDSFYLVFLVTQKSTMQNGYREAIIHASSEMSQSYNSANFTIAVFVPQASPTIRGTFNKRRVYEDKGWSSADSQINNRTSQMLPPWWASHRGCKYLLSTSWCARCRSKTDVYLSSETCRLVGNTDLKLVTITVMAGP